MKEVLCGIYTVVGVEMAFVLGLVIGRFLSGAW